MENDKISVDCKKVHNAKYKMNKAIIELMGTTDVNAHRIAVSLRQLTNEVESLLRLIKKDIHKRPSGEI